MKKLLPLFILLLSSVVSAQEEVCSVINSSAEKISKISNIYTELRDNPACKDETMVGAVREVFYIESSRKPYSIIISGPISGQRQINFLPDFLSYCLSGSNYRMFETQLVKGAEVLISGYDCGAAGNGKVLLDSIQFARKGLNKRKRK